MSDNIFGVDVYVDPATLEGQSTDTDTKTEDTAQPTAPDTDGQGEEVKTEPTEDKEVDTPSEPPQLILGKFKNEDAVKKAHNDLARKIEAELGKPYGYIKQQLPNVIDDYQSLQAYYTQLRQHQKTQVKEQPKGPTQEELDNDFMQKFYEEVDTDPVAAYQKLAKYEAEKMFKSYKSEIEQKVSPIITERTQSQKYSTINSLYPDISKFDVAMNEEVDSIINERPDLINNPDADALIYEFSYLRSKVKTLEEQAKTAFENGKKAALEERNKKAKINNEINNNKDNSNTLPEGITIVGMGDGIFI